MGLEFSLHGECSLNRILPLWQNCGYLPQSAILCAFEVPLFRYFGGGERCSPRWKAAIGPRFKWVCPPPCLLDDSNNIDWQK